MYLIQEGEMLSVTSDYLSPKTLFSFKPFSKATSADGKHAVLRKGDMAFLRGYNSDWMTLAEEKPELTQGEDDPAEEVLPCILLVYVLNVLNISMHMLFVLRLSLVISSMSTSSPGSVPRNLAPSCPALRWLACWLAGLLACWLSCLLLKKEQSVEEESEDDEVLTILFLCLLANSLKTSLR